MWRASVVDTRALVVVAMFWRRVAVVIRECGGSASMQLSCLYFLGLDLSKTAKMKLKGRFWFAFLSGGLGNSVILTNDVGKISQLNTWLLPHLQSSVRSYWNLCYRATSYGWRSSTFHSYCDNRGPTVVIVRAGGYIFGGYNDNSWQCKSAKL